MSVLVLVLCLPLLLWGQVTQAQSLKAFPSAEGYGAATTGGRGGRIVTVTNLNDSGAGSLRDALSVQTGPRYVLFAVSGTITLTSGPIYVRQANSYVTIAGHTSPGGVQVKGDGIFVVDGAHDVIMRHMRIRPGTHLPAYEDTNAFLAWANSTSSGPDIVVYNVIIDHSEFQWADDQQGPDAFHTVTNMTTQWSIIGPGTNQGHSGGAPGAELNHNFGMLASSSATTTYTVHHNLLPNLGGRGPLVGQVGVFDFRNNIIYNWNANGIMQWGSYLLHDTEYRCYDTGASAMGNHVNNYYIGGPFGSTQLPYLTIMNAGPQKYLCPEPTSPCVGCNNPAERGGSKIYTSGTWGPYCPTGCANDWDNGWTDLDGYFASRAIDPPASNPCAGGCPAIEANYRVATPFPVPAVTTDATSTLKAKLLAPGVHGVGTTVPSRDSFSQSLINDVQGETTGNPNAQGAGGPWPTLTGGAPPTDTDGDGIPDAWEVAHGLNPALASDGPAVAANGYTNVENYLNELAGDTIPGMLAGGQALWWRFDEGTGTTTTDQSGNGFHGTLVASPTWGPGRQGSGMVTMNGTTQYVTTGSLIWTAGQPVTVLLWIKAASCTASGAFGAPNTAVQDRFGAHLPWSDCVVYFDYGDWRTTGRISVDFTPYLGKWTRVALVSSGPGGSFKAIYFNGVLAASGTSSDGPTINLTTLDVGRWPQESGTLYEAASLDNFRVENRVWSAAEILSDYRQQAMARRHRISQR